MLKNRAIIVLLWIATVLAAALPAQADVEFGGRIGEFFTATRNLDGSAFYSGDDEWDLYSLTALRLTLAGEIDADTDWELHALSRLDLSDAGFLQGTGVASYRALDLTMDGIEDGDLSAGLSIDRLSVRRRFGRMDLTLGRQAMSFGKAWFWNPMDVYAPFTADQVDRDYKAGVDAARLDFYLNDFDGLTFVAAAGPRRDPDSEKPGALQADWYGSSLLGRFYATRNGWDVALQGGKVYGGWQAAGGTVGQLGPWQLRAEAAFFRAEDSPALPGREIELYEDHWTAIVGLGRYFSKPDIDLEMEYLFNDAGETEDLTVAFERLSYGAAPQIGRHLVGVSLFKEYTPLQSGRLTAIASLNDRSILLQPTYSFSLTENSDLTVGAALNLGREPEGTDEEPDVRSEFGSWPDSLFAEFKMFF